VLIVWICLNSGFYSIVKKDCGADQLLVRARRNDDIEKIWPAARVHELAGSDYAYRAAIPKADVVKAIATRIRAIDYSNFKDSVEDDRLHQAYARIWQTMAALQN
jgi:hypothetical protein